jgi:predicted nucleotidyltransferase
LNEGIPKAWQDLITAWLVSKPRIVEAYFFGSRVKGSWTETSDVDVGLVISENTKYTAATVWWFDLPQWRLEVENLLPVKLDLQFVNPEEDGHCVVSQIADHAVRFYKRDPIP